MLRMANAGWRDIGERERQNTGRAGRENEGRPALGREKVANTRSRWWTRDAETADGGAANTWGEAAASWLRRHGTTGIRQARLEQSLEDEEALNGVDSEVTHYIGNRVVLVSEKR